LDYHIEELVRWLAVAKYAFIKTVFDSVYDFGGRWQVHISNPGTDNVMFCTRKTGPFSAVRSTSFYWWIKQRWVGFFLHDLLLTGGLGKGRNFVAYFYWNFVITPMVNANKQ
jgi:hypothetical protein